VVEPEPARESSLRAERSALTRARAALQAGSASEALSILDTAAREIEKPVLGQEREVVYIQALAGAGRAAEARQRASRFLTAFPDSPHAAVVRRFGND
jgi:outer membrane protein assembly factor BamD (BamD/ComL family)